MEWTVVLAGPAQKSLKRIPWGPDSHSSYARRDAARSISRRYSQTTGPFRLPPPRRELARVFRGCHRAEACRRDRNRTPHLDHVLNYANRVPPSCRGLPVLSDPVKGIPGVHKQREGGAKSVQIA
jgi:hypothetical protein